MPLVGVGFACDKDLEDDPDLLTRFGDYIWDTTLQPDWGMTYSLQSDTIDLVGNSDHIDAYD